MNVSLFYGPDKIKFKINNNCKIESDLNIPFHCIISRGLLNKFIEHHLDVQIWYQYAHRLFQDNFSSNLSVFSEIKKFAEECFVLSFGQSAFCVQKYVELYCQEVNIDDAFVEIWNIKEGHTSSVWRVQIRNKKNTEVFVVNVARDYEAGIELEESSGKLKYINNLCPELNNAKVFNIYFLNDSSLSSQVVITRNEWIENSYEIHSMINKLTGKYDLLLIERFLIDKNNPSYIHSVKGRIFCPEEVIKINNDINDFLTKAKMCLLKDLEININEGDVVWNGEKAIIVAIN